MHDTHTHSRRRVDWFVPLLFATATICGGLNLLL